MSDLRASLSRLDYRACRARRNSSVHEQSLPRYVSAGLRGKEHYRSIQILWLPGAFQRNPIAKIFDPLFVLVEDLVLFGAKPSWSKTIHGDPVLAPIVSQAHRQLPDAASAGSIRRESRVARDTGDRSDVNDASVTARDHATRYRLRNKETSTQVGVKNHVPVFPGYFERRLPDIATCVVHENIHMAEGRFSARNHFPDALMAAHVEFQGKSAAAERFYFRFKRCQSLAIAAGEYKVRARLRQRQRHILPESPARAGDDRHAATEIKQSVAHETIPGVRITFIKFGSRACSLSNQRGPSSKGAMAEIRGFTCIAPVAKSSIARGYSPADAHDP